MTNHTSTMPGGGTVTVPSGPAPGARTTAELFPPRASTMADPQAKAAPPLTAPDCAARAAEALEAARVAADNVLDMHGAPKVTALVEVSRGYRELGVALSQHQAMTPRPPDDDRGVGRRR